jgi:SAM-dependent methyltransferase
LVLKTTRENEFVPGTNLSNRLSAADWRFLLPNLECHSVLVVGIPSKSLMAGLTAMGSKVRVAVDSHGHSKNIEEIARQSGLRDFDVKVVPDFHNMPAESHSIDLVLLADVNSLHMGARVRTLMGELARVLKPQGFVFLESAGLWNAWRSRRWMRLFRESGFRAPRVFWIASRNGGARTVLAHRDTQMVRYFFEHVIHARSLVNRILCGGVALFSRIRMLPYLTARRAVIVRRASDPLPPNRPPDYLVSSAARAGINLEDHRWGFFARGEYDSNKVTFYLFRDSAKLPEIVVMMSRSPRFNSRLENAYRVLSLLEKKAYVGQDTFPRPLFFSYHNELAVFGQEAVNGDPFRARTGGRIDCPYFRAALNWVSDLAAASARSLESDSSTVRDALCDLFERFGRLYKLSREEGRFLERQIDTLVHSRTPLPVVFQHGDPGIWNVLVREAGVTFLDWEAGEPAGLPLWDLFYLARSYGSWMFRLRGHHDSLESATHNFFRLSPFNRFLKKIIDFYCVQVDLYRELARPLFFVCWMHRALKETTRLTPELLSNGHYINLLRLSIANHDAPGLRHMLDSDKGP